jgi:hypothetical protein
MIYTYEKNPVDLERLELEIKSSEIEGSLSHINFISPSMEVVFAEDISVEGKEILDTIISNHSGSPIPHDITPRQARQALLLSGITMQEIEDALDGLPEPQRSLAMIEWEYSTAFVRNNQLVVQVGQMLGWTEQQLDDLWIFAKTL